MGVQAWRHTRNTCTRLHIFLSTAATPCKRRLTIVVPNQFFFHKIRGQNRFCNALCNDRISLQIVTLTEGCFLRLMPRRRERFLRAARKG